MPLPKGYTLTSKGQDALTKQFVVPTKEDIEAGREDFASSEQLFSEWDWQNPQGLGPNGEELPELAIGWRPTGEADFGTGLTGFWNKFKSNVSSAWETGYKEGLQINGIAQYSIKKREGEEKGQETIDAMQAQRKPQDEAGAKRAAFAEATKEVFNQSLWGLLDGLGQASVWAEQAIGTAGHSIDRIAAGEQVTKETLSRDWQASRLAYSQFFDVSIYAEMNRRLDAEMRGDLAAQEVMIENKWTMWPELIGQVLLDPLNALTIWGKAGNAIKLEKKAAKTFHEIANPETARVWNAAMDAAGQMDEAKAYQLFDELAASYDNVIAGTETKLDELSNTYKLSSLTRDGKVAHLANDSGEILMHIVNNSDPDEALEILDGMRKLASKDKAVRAEGFAIVSHFADPVALLSEAGQNTTVMIGKVFDKYGDTWLKTLDELKGNPVELTKNLLGKLDEVGEEMFPSVSKMLEAEKAVKAGGEVTEATRALADRAAKLPEYVKAATKFHDTAQKVVGPINKFFIGAYMGWSPGYAFRNFSNNSLQLLIDYGPGVLLGKADDMFAKAEKLHGGIIQGAFSEGGQAAALFPEKAVMKETGLAGLVDAAKQKGLKGPVLGMSQTLEANAAKRIIAKTYRQTFDKGIKAMVKSLTPSLREAGFSDDVIKKLPTYINQFDGDATKVINKLREDVASGVIDLFNDINRIDPKSRSFLEGAGKWDEYAEQVLQAPTREAAEAAAKKIFDDLAQAGDHAYRDARPAVDNYDKFLKSAESSGLPPQRGQLISLRKTENRKAIQAAEAILAEADDLGAKLGLQVGSMKKARGITGLNTWGNDAAKEADRLSDLAWKLTRDVKGAAGANLNELWTKYPELFPGTPPAGLNKQTFLDALWHSYDAVVSRTWGGARDTAIDNVTGYLDDLKAAGAEVPEQWREAIKQAQEGAQQYDNAMIGRFGELVEDTPLEYGARTSQISQIATRYGIATATEAGAPLDSKILKTINKYADVNYKSLEDVPLDVAEEAFKAKTTKATKATQAVEAVDKKALWRERFALQKRMPELQGEELTQAQKRMQEIEGALKAPATETKAVETVTQEAAQYQPKTPGGKFSYEPRKNDTFSIEAEGGSVRGYLKNADFDGDKSSPQRGEIFWVESKVKRQGVGRSLMLDAINAMAREGVELLNLSPTNDAARKLNSALVRDGYLELIRTSDTGKEEYKIIKSALDLADETAQATDETAQVVDEAAHYDDAGKLVEPARKRILPPPTDGEAPTAARAIYEQKEAVGEMRAWIMDDIGKNFGKKQLIDKVTEGAMTAAERELKQKLAETRLISSRVAQANRDFTLLNYGDKSYWDVALAYLYPFHYWYKGTYTNWMKRVAQNPSVLAHYQRYKENLGTVHAGMPEWWKYNINTNDLPGVDVENPLYFNLEATLWPLNGITGLDFNDKSKRVNAWTSGLDYLNKFGPSTWTPLSMVTGIALYAQGEREAGEKWMGRLFPQSATIKAAGSLLGATNLETDPFVNLFQGGLDPYERRRVQRALAQMDQEAQRGDLPYTPEQIMDAAYSQEGPIWEEAMKRAIRGRAPSQISSYLFGVGFKGRSQEDMEIDNFMTDYSRLWTMRPNLSPEEFREGMDTMKSKYPFMDTVLLSKRDGVDRDAGLAYTVMTRIPPGKSSKIAEAAGIDPALLDKFYADKGQIEGWSPADRQRFMSGILTMASVLEIPSDMTRKEWTEAKNTYSKLSTEAKSRFGDDILDAVDGYYQAKTKSYDAADAYLERHPEVEEYMNWRSERIRNSPLLMSYYGGASIVENYHKSQMYGEIEKELGSEIFDVMEEYNDLKTYGEPGEAKRFYNQNKARIKQYYSIRDEWQVTIDQQLAYTLGSLPEGEPAGIREDFDATSPLAQNLVGALQPEYQPSFQDFQAQVPERLLNLVVDYYETGDRLTESAEKQLERVAREMGYQSGDELREAIGVSLYSTP